jgi:hypothetical protein
VAVSLDPRILSAGCAPSPAYRSTKGGTGVKRQRQPPESRRQGPPEFLAEARNDPRHANAERPGPPPGANRPVIFDGLETDTSDGSPHDPGHRVCAERLGRDEAELIDAAEERSGS